MLAKALANRRWGVCFGNDTKIRFGNEYFWWRLQFIYAPDGTCLLREWSSRDWIAFAPKETRVWALFPELILPIRGDRDISHRCCQFTAKSVREELLFRRVSDEEIERLSWKSSTSRAEFERVVNWLWETALLEPEEAASRYAGASLSSSRTYKQTIFYFPAMKWLGSDELLGWLRAYFVLEGFEWHSSDWGKRRFRKLRAQKPHLRVFFEPHSVNWRVSFNNRPEPTFHEQLEARLHLRDWLRDKVPDADIDTWLAPSVQT